MTIVAAALSPSCLWQQQLNDAAMSCRSRDARGKCVYHTNVMMSVGTDVAVICLASLASDAQRRAVLTKLEEHHEVGWFYGG